MSADRTALNILLSVTRDGAFANLALKEGLSYVRPNEVGRTTALVYTALENLNYCDFIIDHYAKGRLHTAVRGILRIAVAELFFMDDPAHAVCNRAVELTSEIGKARLKGFVNGVLRSIVRDKESGNLPPLPEDFKSRMEIISGYPGFMIEEYARLYGEPFTEELLTSSIRSLSIRPVGGFPEDELIESISSRCVSVRKSDIAEGALVVEGFNGSVAGDELFRSGKFTVQSESAMLACECLEPKPGEKVLDACAAPGGKTAYICDIMRRSGSVTAWDVHPHRAELIAKTLERLGVTGVDIAVNDAAVPLDKYSEWFDRVLCDVPCSGLGGGSKPDARYRRTDESIKELTEVQHNILSACSGYLIKGGVLVYSTCTVSERENELAVRRFLNENEEYELVSLDPVLKGRFGDRGSNGMLQLFPNVDRTEGFFIAKMRRKI
ncbi:MAG: 16S rRNA (cytosine(967)-C(5))-methyltransferase RsmB [Clostridia bacterium]|nr:16S rRNA (cytosine(967)-C(5))-methyltransferase RsmB [Clostridia bacterium]